MKIALDAVGGGLGLAPQIEGAILAANADGVELILAGPAARLRAELSARGIAADDRRFEVEDSSDPVTACAELVSSGRAAAFVSAAGPAQVLEAARRLPRLAGAPEPSLALPVPTPRGVALLIDAPLEPETAPLVAALGLELARRVYGKASPRAAELSLGGPSLSGLQALDGREVASGRADVVLCGGSVGRALAEAMEGAAAAMGAQLRAELGSSWRYKLPGLVLRGPLTRARRRCSFDEHSAALVLGVDAVAAACRSEGPKAVANALRAAAAAARSDLLGALRETLARAGAAVRSTAAA